MRAEQAMSRSAISDRMLRDLSHLERADVLRRIQMLTALKSCKSASASWPSGNGPCGSWPSAVWYRFPGPSGLLCPCPGTTSSATGASHGPALTSSLGCLAITAWGLWKRRQIVVPASMITSVLLLCDAWFDVLTANGYRDLIVSAASALFAELPWRHCCACCASGPCALPRARRAGWNLTHRSRRYGVHR